MNPFDRAWDFLKGTRQLEYDAFFNPANAPEDAMGLNTNMTREQIIRPGPLPGFVYFYDIQTGDEKLMTESEAEKIWPSHIDSKSYLGPSKHGLSTFADYAASEKDPHFDEQKTIDRFTRKRIAPLMAHEIGHSLDSQFGEGSEAQQEMPAHILEQATRDVLNDSPPRPIIPIVNRLTGDRNFTGEDNPNYQYDITDDTII
jgi:hypothetical protein